MPAFEWRRFLVALAATLASLTVLWSATPPVYLTNDDVTIRLSVEGGLVPGQRAVGYALMTHAALGWMIAWASNMLPSMPLWDLVVTATLVLGVAVLSTVLWPALGNDSLARATVVAVVAVAVFPLLGAVQFTFSSTVAGSASIMLAFAELRTSTRPRTSVLALGAALLAVGMLVRPMAGAAGAVAAATLLLPLAAAEKRIGTAASIGLAVIGLFALLQWIDTTLYALHPDWDRYHRYNWMLARLLEWGGGLTSADIESIRASTGWSSNDWYMLAGWLGVDPAVHGFDRVATAYEAHAAGGWTASLSSFTRRVASFRPAAVLRLLWEAAAVLAVTMAVAVVYVARRGRPALAAICALFVVVCVGIEAVFKELPLRLLAPLQVCLAGAALLSTGTLRRPPRPLARVIALSAVFAVAIDRAIDTQLQLRSEHANAMELQRHVKALEMLAPSLVVLHGDAFPAEVWWRPFRRAPSGLTTIRLGDNNQNPLLQRFLSATGRQPLLRAACEDPSMLLVSVDGRLEPATEYLREHFRLAVRWQQVYARSFAAWRCERVDRSQMHEASTDEALNRQSQ